MNTIPCTVTPREPLTVAELQALADKINRGTTRMCDATGADGQPVWTLRNGFNTTLTDIFGGFYQLRDNTAILAHPQENPWNTPEGKISITGRD